MIDDEEARDNFLKDVCTFLRKFSHISFGVMPKVISIAWERFGKIKDALMDEQYQQEDIQELMSKLLEDVRNINEELSDNINCPSWNRPTFYDDDDDEYTIIYNKPKAITPDLPIEEPDNSLSMGDEHLDTILIEIFRSHLLRSIFLQGVRPCELAPILPGMNEDEFDEEEDDCYDYDTSSDDDSYENIEYVKASPLNLEIVSLEEVNEDQEEKEFDLEDILQIQDVILHEKLLNINRLIANIESLNDNPTPDYVLKSSSLDPISITDSDSFFEKFDTSFSHLGYFLPNSTTCSGSYGRVEPDQGRLISIVISDNSNNPVLELPEFEVNDVDQEEKEFDLEDIFQIQDVILREKLVNINHLIANIEALNDNPSPDHVLKSPSLVLISITDSDSFFEKSDTSFSFSDNSLLEFETFSDHTKETRSGSTTTHANNSFPEYDSFLFEGEPDQGRLIRIVISNNSNDPLLELLEFESFHFDPSFPRPPPKPPDVEICLNFEPDTTVINNFHELNVDECFYPGGGEIVVSQNVEDDDSFTFIIRTFLPYLTYPEVSPLLSSTENEDTIFLPRHLYLEPVASHRDGTLMIDPKLSEDSRVRCFVPAKRSGKFAKNENDRVKYEWDAKQGLVGNLKSSCMDIAKSLRKRSKPGKHRHGNGRAHKEPGECYQRLKSRGTSKLVTWLCNSSETLHLGRVKCHMMLSLANSQEE
ncbi:hypothetical protein Tco_1188714 [Tanacetum coccineum]